VTKPVDFDLLKSQLEDLSGTPSDAAGP